MINKRFLTFAMCLVLSVLAGSNSTLASTSYHGCQSIDGRFHLSPPESDGEQVELLDKETKLPISSRTELTLSDRHGFCLANDNRSYKWHVRKYISTVNTKLDGYDFSLTFVCTNNQTGTPAGVKKCNNTITQNTQLVPTYIDKQSQGKDAVLPKDIQVTYALSKDQCKKEDWTLIKMASRRISGPQFDCALSNSGSAGSGLMSADAICSVDGKIQKKPIALDLGNYNDHFELSLPGREGWIKLYPCSPVPGLQ